MRLRQSPWSDVGSKIVRVCSVDAIALGFECGDRGKEGRSASSARVQEQEEGGAGAVAVVPMGLPVSSTTFRQESAWESNPYQKYRNL